MKSYPCPSCGHAMSISARGHSSNSPYRRTRDHILPRERGGLGVMYGDTRNIRIMCARCNGILADCFHCVGALACVRAVASNEPSAKQITVIRMLLCQWQFGKICERTRKAIADEKDARDGSG